MYRFSKDWSKHNRSRIWLHIFWKRGSYTHPGVCVPVQTHTHTYRGLLSAQTMKREPLRVKFGLWNFKMLLSSNVYLGLKLTGLRLQVTMVEDADERTGSFPTKLLRKTLNPFFSIYPFFMYERGRWLTLSPNFSLFTKKRKCSISMREFFCF